MLQPDAVASQRCRGGIVQLFLFLSLSFLVPPLVAEALVFLATKRTGWFAKWLRSPAEFAFGVALAAFLICGWIGVLEGLLLFLFPVDFHPGMNTRLPRNLPPIAAGLWRECKLLSGMNLLTGIPWGTIAAWRVYSLLRRQQHEKRL